MSKDTTDELREQIGDIFASLVDEWQDWLHNGKPGEGAQLIREAKAQLHKLLVAERIKGELKGFDKAFDSHDYDGLRKYRAELQAQLTQVGDE